MEYSDSSTSSDEEILDIIRHIERSRNFRTRENQFEKYSDLEFKNRFRLTKNTVNLLIELIGHNLNVISSRRNVLSIIDQVLLTLRFYATGSFHILIGDDHNIHKTTVCRVVQKVTREIANLRPQYVKMPQNENEIRSVKAAFYTRRQFPNVIGCIDGSHIPIQSPGGEHAEIFRNRKGYFSVNVQVVCDSNLMIRDIVARWPGSTHDSTMFNSSLICASLEANEFPSSYLLGDSAYSCKEYLLTPILNPITVGETNYNAAHIQTRNTVERTFGVWKRRFACLSLGLRTKLSTTVEVIVATAVLHNMAILQQDLLDNFEEIVEIDIPLPIYENIDNAGGVALRNSLIENYFS